MIQVDPKDLDQETTHEAENIQQLKKKACDLDILVDLMKEKLKVSNRKKKIQILTIAPKSWSMSQVCETFGVTEYMVRQARKLANEKGILEFPEQKQGNPLSKETEDLVTKFYCDDEYSRQMPGKKDFVSISKNVHKQKKLLLCNLKELYSIFKAKNPEV